MSSNCTLNRVFCNHTRVLSLYCDGGGRMGNVPAPLTYYDTISGRTLFYARGWPILLETMAELLREQPGVGLEEAGSPLLLAMPSLSIASELVVAGFSSGGQSALVLVDAIAALARSRVPTLRVKAVIQAGFFADIGERKIAAQVRDAAWLHRFDLGALSPGAGPSECTRVQANRADGLWRCALAEVAYPYTTTPSFLMQSKLDTDMLGMELPAAARCGFSPGECSPTALAAYRAFTPAWLAALMAARERLPSAAAAANGGIIVSCPYHALEGSSAHRMKVHGASMYDAMAAWLAGRTRGSNSWRIDPAEWPANPTCPAWFSASPSRSHTASRSRVRSRTRKRRKNFI